LGTDKNYINALGEYIDTSYSYSRRIKFDYVSDLSAYENIDFSCYTLLIIDDSIEINSSFEAFILEQGICILRLGIDIYKYSTADKLETAIFNAIRTKKKGEREKLGNDFAKKEEIYFIDAFSVSGGVGTSTVSFGLARELARYRGLNVLYVCLDSFILSGFCPGGEMEQEELVGQVADAVQKLLYLHERGDKEKWISALNACLYRDNYKLYRFRTMTGQNALRTLDFSSLVCLIADIVLEKGIDTIVLDRGTYIGNVEALIGEVNGRNWKMLPVFVSSPKSIGSVSKSDIAETVLSNNNKNSIVKVENMVEITCDIEIVEEGEQEATQVDIDVKIYSDENDVCKRNGKVEIALANVFSHGIKELADLVLARLTNEGGEKI
jgi:hypothetical protein